MSAVATTVYELWDIESGNLIGDYAGELAALGEVRAGVREDGTALWESVALARVESGGTRTPIAQGAELIARATAILTALQVIDALADFDIEAAMRAIGGVIDALAHTATALERAIASAQVEFDLLARRSGKALHIDARTDTVTIATPDETLAGLLSARIARAPYPVQLRAVDKVYQIELAATDAATHRRIAS